MFATRCGLLIVRGDTNADCWKCSFYDGKTCFFGGCLFGCLLLFKRKKVFFNLESNKHPNKHPEQKRNKLL